MRPTVLLLAAAVALSLVLPCCNARPGETYVKKQSSQQASASAAAESESSESIVKKGGCGCGCGGGGSYSASKKHKSKAVAASSASSSSSYEAKKVDSCKKELTVDEIKKEYCQKQGESSNDYFKRILAKNYDWTSTNEAWLKTLSIVREQYSTLSCWYSLEYLDIVKPYYTACYAKEQSEDLAKYFNRLCAREKWETGEQFSKRMTLIRDCFPSLPLWSSPKYYENCTKSLYAAQYKRWSGESEDEYVKRLIEKDQYCDTSDSVWAARVFLILEATIPSCSLWYDVKYKEIFDKWYKIYYKKQENVSCEDHLRKLCALLPNESPENAIKRIEFIKEATSDCGCWKTEYFKKLQEAKCFEESWVKMLKEKFFPCGCGGGVTIEKKSSKKSSVAASASSEASSESEYSKTSS